MRKIAIVLAILMLAPASAFGMQMLTDSGMAQITGQSGVSIAMDDVQLFINIDRMAYIDNDGLSSSATMQIQGTNGAPGALYIQDFQIDVLNINAIVGTDADALPQTLNLKSSSAGSIPLFYDYADTTPLSGGRLRSLSYDPATDTFSDVTTGSLKGLENYTPLTLSPASMMSPGMFTANAITIEVTDRLPVLTEGFNYNTLAEYIENQMPGSAPEGSGIFGLLDPGQHTNVGGVFITLPTAEIYIQSLGFTVAYTGDVYAQTLQTTFHASDGYTYSPPNPFYTGPMGALTSRAINNNALTSGFLGFTDYGLEGDYGSIDIQGITFTQLSGWMEIAPH